MILRTQPPNWHRPSGYARALPVLAALSVIGCGGRARAPIVIDWTGPATLRTSTQTQRESVALTVYNDNFGLVREVRRIDLAPGKVSLEVRDVAAQILPESVHLQPLDAGATLPIAEQSFRFDLLTPARLLEKSVGKCVRFYRWNDVAGHDETIEATLLSYAAGQPVFDIDGAITGAIPGRISFPEAPTDLLSAPTLVWTLGSDRAKQRVELSYLTGGVGWHSDYVLRADPSMTHADLGAWVTLTNDSGVTFENTSLRVVAGNVHRVSPRPPEDTPGETEELMKAKMDKDESPRFVEERLFEYHLYALDRPTTLRDHEQKQLRLLDASAIPIRRVLIARSTDNGFFNIDRDPVEQSPDVEIVFRNDEAAHLGIPLPKGTLRVLSPDSSGADQFVGAAEIDHTARDEDVHVPLGSAFDVRVVRRQTALTIHDTCSTDSTWEVVVDNGKATAQPIDLVESSPSASEIALISSSIASTHPDAHTFVFSPTVDARGQARVTFTIRSRRC